MRDTKDMSLREYSREQLMEELKKAEKNICMIGTVSFDLDWEELKDTLVPKFLNSDLNIQILRESETIIAQYALLMSGQIEDRILDKSLSRGNLNGIRDRVLKQLKEELVAATKGGERAIEPPEDTYAKDIGREYYSAKRNYMLESYAINGCWELFLGFLEEKIESTLEKSMSVFASSQQFVNKMTSEILTNPSFPINFAAEANNVIKGRIEDVEKMLLNQDVLKSLDIEGASAWKSVSGVKGKINKNGSTDLLVEVAVNVEGLSLCQDVILPVDAWILGFEPMGSSDSLESKRYRLVADKKQAEVLATEKKKKLLETLKADKEKRQRLFIKNCYMPIPVPLLRIDDKLFITQAITKFGWINKFQFVGYLDKPNDEYESYWLDEFRNYYRVYFESPNGAQRYSTEETKKGNRKEIIDIFDESRIRIGIGPRDAFLSNMSIVKSVVWALIFDREGRVLIHQRSANAKDNQGLWDKSVGGHVSTEDLDTIEAVKREIAEELFTLENEGQGGHDIVQWMVTNKNKIIYLGDWKTARFPDLTALHLRDDEYYNFSLNYPDINRRDFRKEVVLTERLLPSGERVKAKCFVDPYLCIVSEDFDITKLQNSKYALLTPNELKQCVMNKSISLNSDRIYDPTGIEYAFEPTSDLGYLVSSAIWDDVITEFSQQIREAFSKKNRER
jgi:hypothetical protein